MPLPRHQIILSVPAVCWCSKVCVCLCVCVCLQVPYLWQVGSQKWTPSEFHSILKNATFSHCQLRVEWGIFWSYSYHFVFQFKIQFNSHTCNLTVRQNISPSLIRRHSTLLPCVEKRWGPSTPSMHTHLSVVDLSSESTTHLLESNLSCLI